VVEASEPLTEQAIRGQRLVANYVLLSTGECVAKGLGMMAFAHLARILGPQGYGHLEFTLAIIFFFTLFVDSGLGAYGAREIARDRHTVARLTVHVVFMRFVLAMGSFALLSVIVAVIDKPWPVKQLILLYGLTLFGLPGLLQWVFQGRDMMQYVAMASIIRWSIFAAGVFLLIRGMGDIRIAPLIEGLAIGCVVAFYLWALQHHFGFPRQRIEHSFALSLLRQALPIGASDVVWALKAYFATVLLGVLIGGSEVGWFGAAHRIVISLHTFVWLYFFNLLPSIARCAQGPPEALRRLMAPSIRVTAWLAVFVGVAGTVFAPPIIRLVYGPQYHEAVRIFQVLIWVIPIALMSGHYRYTLIAFDRQRLEFLTAACGAGLNILLNLFLIPSYGLFGAACALLTSEVLIWALSHHFVYRTIMHIPIWVHTYRPLVTGVILAVALYILSPTNLWVAGSSAVVLYCLVLAIVQPELLSDVGSMLIRNR